MPARNERQVMRRVAFWSLAILWLVLIAVFSFRTPIAAFVGSLIGLGIGILIGSSRERWVCHTCEVEYDSSRRFLFGSHKTCPNGCPSDR